MRLQGKTAVAAILATTVVASVLGATVAYAVLGQVTVAGKGIKQVKVVTDTHTGLPISSVSWVDLPGATTTITEPGAQQAFILVRFTSESYCSGSANNWCSVRALVNDVELNPQTAHLQGITDFGFDSTSGGDQWEGHAMDLVTDVLGPGTYTIRLQVANTAPDVTFFPGNWMLTGERVARLRSRLRDGSEWAERSFLDEAERGPRSG